MEGISALVQFKMILSLIFFFLADTRHGAEHSGHAGHSGDDDDNDDGDVD